MDLRLTDDRELHRRRVHGHVRPYLAMEGVCSSTLTPVGEGVGGIRRLVIAYQCRAA